MNVLEFIMKLTDAQEIEGTSFEETVLRMAEKIKNSKKEKPKTYNYKVWTEECKKDKDEDVIYLRLKEATSLWNHHILLLLVNKEGIPLTKTKENEGEGDTVLNITAHGILHITAGWEDDEYFQVEHGSIKVK